MCFKLCLDQTQNALRIINQDFAPGIPRAFSVAGPVRCPSCNVRICSLRTHVLSQRTELFARTIHYGSISMYITVY